MVASENTSLLSSETVSAVANTGTMLFQEVSANIKNQPLSFRVLGFFGGIAMIFSNAFSILFRFLTLNITGAVIAVYGVIFGIVIALIDAPIALTQTFKIQIHIYARFLDFMWGRGLLYLFVGVLQISNWNILDWSVGGFMIFVGITALVVSLSSGKKFDALRASISSERQLKQHWDRYDTDGNGQLDIKEFTAFVKSCCTSNSNNDGVVLTANEIAAIFLSLDKNFDDKIAYDEFKAWWTSSTDASSTLSSSTPTSRLRTAYGLSFFV